MTGFSHDDGVGYVGLNSLPHTTICPHCGKDHDLVSHPGSNEKVVPREGDFTMCIGCGQWCVYDEKLVLHVPTAEQQAEIDAHPEVKRIRRIWDETAAKRVELGIKPGPKGKPHA